MRIIKKMLKGKCVYWALATNDSGGTTYDNYGQPRHAAPVELKCRWEDRNEEFIGPRGTRQVSRAVVYVESDVDVGGMLFNGALDDLESGEFVNPRAVDGAWEIMRFDRVPTLKQTHFLRTAYL